MSEILFDVYHKVSTKVRWSDVYVSIVLYVFYVNGANISIKTGTVDLLVYQIHERNQRKP